MGTGAQFRPGNNGHHPAPAHPGRDTYFRGTVESWYSDSFTFSPRKFHVCRIRANTHPGRALGIPSGKYGVRPPPYSHCYAYRPGIPMNLSVRDFLFAGPEVESPNRYQLGGYHPVHIGDFVHERYRVIHKLGFGTFSTVWLARDLQPAVQM